MKCGKCGGNELEFNFPAGKIFCNFCGFLFEENILNPEVSFDKNGLTKKTISGQIIRNQRKNFYSEKTFLTTLNRNGFQRKISQIGNLLKLSSRHVEAASHLYAFANQQKLFPNKKIDILCISCLYVICRQNRTPHLLVDFSDITQIRANKIGVDFLRFRKLMNLSLPIIDPSLFVHRFANQLQLGPKINSIILTSLRLIARMKRDWISTGRRPAGLCGAALLLATRLHGVKKTKKQISDVVRIGNIILSSRLKEIKKSSISSLSAQEINFGGGDDGDKDSLRDFYRFNQLQPPSRKIWKKKSHHNQPTKEVFEAQLTIKKQKFAGKKKHWVKNFIIKKESKMLKNRKIRFKRAVSKKGALVYVNSNFETFVKESIWFQSNSKFIFSQSVNARAQKERPFAFFGSNN